MNGWVGGGGGYVLWGSHRCVPTGVPMGVKYLREERRGWSLGSNVRLALLS